MATIQGSIELAAIAEVSIDLSGLSSL